MASRPLQFCCSSDVGDKPLRLRAQTVNPKLNDTGGVPVEQM